MYTNIRRELALWLFISLYGLSGLILFKAWMPKYSKSDSELVHYDNKSYVIWFLSSIIFFLYGVFVVQNVLLVGLIMMELVVIILFFVCTLIQKREQTRSFSERLRIKFKSEMRRRH